MNETPLSTESKQTPSYINLSDKNKRYQTNHNIS